MNSEPAKILQAAIGFHQSGNLVQAEANYERYLEHEPWHAEVLHFAGVLKRQLKKLEASEEYLRRALECSPDEPSYMFDLGNTLSDHPERLGEAVEIYQRALEVRPEHSLTYVNLGKTLRELERLDEAESAFSSALKLQADSVEALEGLAHVVNAKGDSTRALALSEQGLKTAPERANLWLTAGRASAALGDLNTATFNLNRAADLAGENCALLNLVARAFLREVGLFDAAEKIFSEVVARNPEGAEERWNYSMMLLLKGDYERGWQSYEARWDVPGFGTCSRHASKERWDGSQSVLGKSILLQTEQGFGDMIQFVRYAELLAADGALVMIEALPAIRRLITSAHSVHHVITPDDPAPDVDLHCPIMSLPAAFRTTLSTIPAPVRYFESELSLRAQWKERISHLPWPRIGICWQGKSSFKGDKHRSIPLKEFQPLLELPVTVVNIHKGEGESQIELNGFGSRIHNFSDEVYDFTDTAALIDNLDLVITSDTSIAHLSGALGRATWVLLQKVPDWRWHLDGEDSLWYPCARLFRQRKAGDWAEVISRACEALELLLEQA